MYLCLVMVGSIRCGWKSKCLPLHLLHHATAHSHCDVDAKGVLDALVRDGICDGGCYDCLMADLAPMKITAEGEGLKARPRRTCMIGTTEMMIPQ